LTGCSTRACAAAAFLAPDILLDRLTVAGIAYSIGSSCLFDLDVSAVS
jgi:hypothetical protein